LPRRPKVKLKPTPRQQVPIETSAPRAMWLGLVAIAFIAYWPALWNGLTYDDRGTISDSDYLLSHLSLAPRLFT
jgi:hypothetical protein